MYISTWINHKNITLNEKKQVPEDDINYDTIYIQIKNRQNYTYYSEIYTCDKTVEKRVIFSQNS